MKSISVTDLNENNKVQVTQFRTRPYFELLDSFYKHRNGRLLVGAIVVFHPFSKNMGFNPHLHVLVTEGGFDKNNKFIHQKFIPFRAMRKTWQYKVLTNFKAAFQGNLEFSMLANHLFKKYPEGFYVHLPEKSRITNKRKIARYVARHIRHPMVSNTRLYRYDGKSVILWYKNHKDKRLFVIMKVEEFITALIQHIPDRNFKMIRYSGAYGRKIKKRYSRYLQRSLNQLTFANFSKKRNTWALICLNCGDKMSFEYYEKGPPEEKVSFGSKLPD